MAWYVCLVCTKISTCISINIVGKVLDIVDTVGLKSESREHIVFFHHTFNYTNIDVNVI